MKRWIDFIGGKMWLDPEASEFEALMAASRWEWRKVDLLKQHIKPGSTFVDAGAHWGYFSLIACKLGARVIAIEPERDTNFSQLCRNFTENAGYQYECWPVALWNEEALLPMFEGYSTGTHSLVKQYAGNERRVQTKTLDSILARRTVDVVKMDVEGAEVQALEGALDTLLRAGQMVLVMDLHPELGVKTDEVGQLLRGCGFNLFDIRSGNLPIVHVPDTLVELLATKGHHA